MHFFLYVLAFLVVVVCPAAYAASHEPRNE